MKKIILIFGITLMASGCIPTDEERRQNRIENAKMNAEVAKICKEAGQGVRQNTNGDLYCAEFKN